MTTPQGLFFKLVVYVKGSFGWGILKKRKGDLFSFVCICFKNFKFVSLLCLNECSPMFWVAESSVLFSSTHAPLSFIPNSKSTVNVDYSVETAATAN